MVAGTVALLRQMKTNPGSNFASFDGYVESLTSKGFNIRNSPNEQRDVMYQKFIDNVTQNLEDRFPDLPVLSCFSVFNPAALPEDPEELQSFGNDDLQTLASHLHLEADKVDQEWLGLKSMIMEDEKLRFRNASSMMKHVCEKLGQPYPNLVKICTVGLLIPTSTADCERGFSTLKRVKTEHRSRLSNRILNCLIHITLQGPAISKFDFDRAAENWYKEKPRRTVF